MQDIILMLRFCYISTNLRSHLSGNESDFTKLYFVGFFKFWNSRRCLAQYIMHNYKLQDVDCEILVNITRNMRYFVRFGTI